MRNVTISLVARNEENQIVGVLFVLTDLGGDRNFQRRGIECTLIQTAHKIASGKKDIAVYVGANEGAGGFYEKCRMKGADVVMKYNKIE